MKVIAVFDIGKTNKKILLFNDEFNVVYSKEQKFETTIDEDGFECDDIDLIENWMIGSIEEIIEHGVYDLQAINFSTYGATLVFINKNGKRFTPLYNYLKPVPEYIQNKLFDNYGGKNEFCRKTASPPLGLLLNSGVQLLWLKNEQPEIYAKVVTILQFPHYLNYLFTKRAISEPTYVGCHSFLWDFDKKEYHRWLADEEIQLPKMVTSKWTESVVIHQKNIEIGSGIHDSSASLVPYLMQVKENFVLLSTGTWCVSMNPFNDEALTAFELENSCLNYLSIDEKPVKASMFFMGHIHDVNVERMQQHFKVDSKAYQKVAYNQQFIDKIIDVNSRVFLKDGTPEKHVDELVDLNQFETFDDAYYQFMFDLTLECAKYLKLTFPAKDNVESLVVSGGFARNMLYINYLVKLFPEKKVYTSQVDNASALGAALACSQKMVNQENLKLDLGLKLWA